MNGNQIIKKMRRQDCFLDKPIPSDFLIWQDDNFVILLDAYPSVKGHTIIAPKQHIEAMSDMSDELSEEFMILIKKVDKALRNIFQPFRVAIVSSGLAVKHLHFHLIPIPNEEMMWGFKYLKKDNLFKYTTDEKLDLITKIGECL